MSTSPSQSSTANPIERFIRGIGQFVLARWAGVLQLIRFFGGAVGLVFDTFSWALRGIYAPEARMSWANLTTQMVRVGILSIPIVMLVQVFIGIILALQMAPTLESYGQIERVADIVVIAVFRELGPLLTGVVLSGFAGASIAAELGTMVEGEEIKALRAIALNPIRFLVVPRVIATVVMLTMLTVLADVIGVFGGFLTSVGILGIEPETYITYTTGAVFPKDFITGLVKACVFGLMIAIIACYEGLNTRGGAEGVGRATTNTVWKSIVALISSDVVFTALFYFYGI